MSEDDAARRLREHKSMCLACNHPSRLLSCAEGSRLHGIVVDEEIEKMKKEQRP